MPEPRQIQAKPVRPRPRRAASDAPPRRGKDTATMRYSEDAPINAVYVLLARLAEPNNPDKTQLDAVMTVASALLGYGQDRSWASVWWAYGALHHDMSEESLERALDLLARVDTPNEARAAALMLQAEIKMTQAAYSSSDPSPAEQQSLLDDAVSRAPDWPSLRLRLARACRCNGNESAAREHAGRALALLRAADPSEDPFDSAISGRSLDRDYVEHEVVRWVRGGRSGEFPRDTRSLGA